MSQQRVSSSSSSVGGIGLTGAVFIVFLVLKLIGVIDWSWWWVTAPLWIPAALVFGVMLGVAAVAIFKTKGSR